MTTYTQQDYGLAAQATLLSRKSYPNLEIRLTCVEDALDNIGFRKFGIIIFWQKYFLKRYRLPKEKSKS